MIGLTVPTKVAEGAMDGKFAGSFGTLAAFSFYTSKNMTVGGDGGMVVSDDEEMISRIRILRNQGSSDRDRYVNDVVGYNFRLNTINAAIGLLQLRDLDKWTEHRRRISKLYLEELSYLGNLIELPVGDSPGNKSAWHLFVIRLKKRDKLKEFLYSQGIETGIHYPIPVHLQKPYRKGLATVPYNMDNTDKWAKEVLSLPIFNEITPDQALFVANKVRNFFGK